MRVKDPFEELEIGQRKAVLVIVCIALTAVLFSLVLPTLAGLIAMIVAFFVMIMLHEFGHFTMAKRSGMKVTEFFVGFGPRLWSTRKGETEYGVKAIPLGGYCKIIGMTNLEEVDPADEPRAYRQKPWHAKMLTVGAGPFVHFVIAIMLMFSVIFFAGNLRESELTTTLSDTTAGAAAAGLQEGDIVIAINGTAVHEWEQVPQLINPDGSTAKPGDTVRFVIRRGDQVFDRTVTMEASTDPALQGRAIAGIASQIYTPRPGFGASIAEAPRQVWSLTKQSVEAIGSVFSPSGIANYFRILAGDEGEKTDESKRFLSPVGFGKVANDAVQSGWVNAIGLLIAINIFVGLFNLLPLLPFDGGFMAIATYEKIASTIRRRRVQVDVAKLMPLTIAVVAVMGFIFLSSLFLDITNPVADPF